MALGMTYRLLYWLDRLAKPDPALQDDDKGGSIGVFCHNQNISDICIVSVYLFSIFVKNIFSHIYILIEFIVNV